MIRKYIVCFTLLPLYILGFILGFMNRAAYNGFYRGFRGKDRGSL